MLSSICGCERTSEAYLAGSPALGWDLVAGLGCSLPHALSVLKCGVPETLLKRMFMEESP